ncbi:MAG: thioredoxin family protein, partial [Thermodesulfobacteriota bacterium]
KLVIVVTVLIVIVGVTLYFTTYRSAKQAPEESANVRVRTMKIYGDTKKRPVPRLVELGADRCIPCKMMAPILEQLRKEYSGKLQVAFIDVWKNPDAAKRYGIRVIPTQIFYDASGKELFRHVGFIPKRDILAKWKELGIPIEKPRNSKENP